MSQNSVILHQNLPIIEVAEEWLLDTLIADSQTSQMILMRLSERVAVVAPGQCDALLARLRKQGHFPKVTQE